MKKQIDNYFSGISDEDIKYHKSEVQRVRWNTNKMLKAEANRLRGKGF